MEIPRTKFDIICNLARVAKIPIAWNEPFTVQHSDLLLGLTAIG